VLSLAVLAGRASAQIAPNPAHDSPATSSKEWSFSLATFGYLVPDDLSYASPTFAADHNWLHLEGRYNYENQKTGSLWAGYNFTAGHALVLEATPMFGVVFGETTAVAPGYELSLIYRRLELSSEGEYVFDTRNHADSFFYSWNELTYSPVEWCHAGLVMQHTRALPDGPRYSASVSPGFAYRKIDYTTYVFNAGWTDPTIVLAFTYQF